jgi:hypothetical protein
VPASVNVMPVFAAVPTASWPPNVWFTTLIWSAICASVTLPLPFLSIMTWT